MQSAHSPNIKKKVFGMKKLLSLVSFVAPSIIGLLPIFLAVSSRTAHAQYTDMQAITDLGGPQEFERRRHAVVEQHERGHSC